MSILKKIRQSRSAARADAKAAKTRARAEVKAASKAELRQHKLLAKQERDLIKAEEKGLKKRRAHEQKLAKHELEKAKAGSFNAGAIQRYANGARAAAPLVLPLIYRGYVAFKREADKRRATKAGISPDQLSTFSGYGAPLRARTAGIRNSLENTNVPAGFKRDVRERLDELDKAIDNAEYMTPQQRQRAHKAISADIDTTTSEIQQRIQE